MEHKNLYRWLVPPLILVAMLGLFLVKPVLAQEVTTVTVLPPTQTVTPGEPFTVDIVVDPTLAIAGVQFDLSFDPLLVTVDSPVTEGNLLKPNVGDNAYFQPGTINNTTGTITGVAGAITDLGRTVSSPGTFVTITFTAGATEGVLPLILSNVIVGDIAAKAVPVQLIGGAVGVGVTPQPGDANADGVLDAVDITKVERIIAGLDIGMPLADANQDGVTNALDITKAERIVASLD